MNEENYKRYRVGVINDFRNSYAFVDYQNFGAMQVWDACLVSSDHRGFQKSSDSIGVFLNFKMIAEFKNSGEALALILRLLREAPVNLSDYEYCLVDAINGETK